MGKIFIKYFYVYSNNNWNFAHIKEPEGQDHQILSKVQQGKFRNDD